MDSFIPQSVFCLPMNFSSANTFFHLTIAKKIGTLLLFFFLVNISLAQSPVKDLRFFLNKDSTQYVKFTFANQAWVRYAENNPGSTVNGTDESETFDIGLRRTRMQLFGKISDRTFFYLQMGMNNFNYLSARKTGFFIHDALGEIAVDKHLSLGAGLTAWTGFSRFSSPSVAGIMGLDAPLFLQATNDANDQFLRKLSVYAKGKLGKLDYRLIVSKPFMFTTSSAYNAPTAISSNAQLSPLPPNIQTSGYVNYQFKDQESNDTPYMLGTYLGKKSVLNVGAGFQYQQDAMWYQQGIDTIQHDMMLAAVDVFYDAPINKEKGNALSIYAVATYFDFGKNYARNMGPMNTTDGVKPNEATFNGTGVAFPMVGTGNSVYAQVGYLTGKLSETKSLGRLMPYISAQYSMYERLRDDMLFVDGGCSWYLDGSKSKLTLGVQNRPVFDLVTREQTTRLNSFILQYQVSI